MKDMVTGVTEDSESVKKNPGNKQRISHWLRKQNRKLKKFLLKSSPQQNLAYGFGVYLIAGWLMLCLPFFHKLAVTSLDSLFIAASALSTTGLATVSVFDTYNTIGQFIILILIQIGGVGYMTFSSFVVLSRHQQLTHFNLKILIAEFSMPKGFELKDFLKSIILFTIFAETIGAILFFVAFKREGIETSFAIWSSIFHSVSSFCTAGFGLYNDSFESFADNTSINIIISLLAILGSLGFIVVTDIWYRLKGKTKAITFTTKVIVLMLVILLIMGTLMFYYFEPATKITEENRLMTAFFQSMTALTTVGFNTIPFGNLSLPLLLFVIFLMYVGASPSGTGGGLKSTTLTAMLAIMWNRIRGNKRVSFLGKNIPIEWLYVATTSFIFYTGLIFFITLFLSFSESFPLNSILFETASALGTVGLSTGITGDLSSIGKLVLIVTMFVGRLGVLTFGLSIFARRTKYEPHKEIEDLAV